MTRNCPFTGTVFVRDRILAGTCHSAKMERTIIVRRNDLHFVNEYQRYEKRRHSNIPAHVSLCFRHKEGLFATLFLLAVFGVATAAAPVSTIHSPDGDVIDCINKLDQPALKHPLLKNHLFQETPTDMVKTNEGFGLQVWHANGASCPDGTIPIRRFEDEISHRKQQNPLVSDAAERATKGHEYAIAYTYGYPIYGAKATLNVWKPIVESGGDFSLAQIWIRSGEYETNDVNTVEAGWTVYPSRYNDSQPRLFTYWTRDAYLETGCYGARCGFVHVSRTIALEAAINQASTFGGDQFDITIQILKDRVTGNWWMAMGLDLVPVGYWPAEIFTTLFNHAVLVQWGGEVYRYTSNTSTILQMGSGEYPEGGFRKAAYFCNIEIAQENRTFLPAEDFRVGATHRDYYTIKKTHNTACGTHFYYGGPGPVRSASVPGAVPFSFLLISVFLCSFVVLTSEQWICMIKADTIRGISSFR